MKIYSEEQVDVIINRAGLHKQRTLRDITPIELPSDEEIEKESRNLYPLSAIPRKLHIRGAKWVIEHIKQQDNE